MHLQRLNGDVGETRSSQEPRAFLSEHAAGEMGSDVSCLARRRGEQIIPWNKVMDLEEKRSACTRYFYFVVRIGNLVVGSKPSHSFTVCL